MVYKNTRWRVPQVRRWNLGVLTSFFDLVAEPLMLALSFEGAVLRVLPAVGFVPQVLGCPQAACAALPVTKC
jgi:hypothetical protein